MRSYKLLAVALLLPAMACGSDPTEPTASGVFPAEGFLGRQARIQVSGDATTWSAGTTVSFGAGVTVDEVSVASPTSLFAEVTISDSAPEGLVDVTVTDGGDTFTLTEAFELRNPISVKVEGTLAQGSVAFVTINNLDFENQFDTTDDGTGTFPNISFTAPAGTEVLASDVTAFTISAVVFMDINATAGPLVLSSGSPDRAVKSPAGQLAVAARAAKVLTPGTPTNGTQTEPFGTDLFELTPPTGAAVFGINVATADPNSNAVMVVLPSSGKIADNIAVTADFATFSKTSEKIYGVYFDNSGVSGNSYQVLGNAVGLTPLAEIAGNNDTIATAQQMTVPAFLDNASYSTETDVDFVKFTTTAADVGKIVHVITAGDPEADLVVEVTGGVAGATAMGGPSDDLDFHENHRSAPIPAGTTQVNVKFSFSNFFPFDPLQNKYFGAVFLETP